MTKTRHEIEASLAAPWPRCHAGERERGATLFGLAQDRFRRLLPALEGRGFPSKRAENGLRPTPVAQPEDDQDGDETRPSPSSLAGFVNQHGQAEVLARPR